MSDTAPNSPPRGGPLIILGTLAAFASFAVIAALLQAYAGGKPSDPRADDRLKFKAEIADAQSALLKKSGLADHSEAVIAKAVAQIGARKLEASKVVVPGSPTAIKQAAAAPAPAAPQTPAKPAATPAPAPAPTPASAPPITPPAVPAPTPVPAAPPGLPVTPPAVPPSAPAPSTPAPAPVPAAPPPAPPVPGGGPN